VLDEYDTQLAALVTARTRATFTVAMDVPILRAAQNERGAYPTGVEVDEAISFREAAERLGAGLVDVEKRIAELNSSFIERVAAELPVETGMALRDAYRRITLPVVYPDATDVSDLLTTWREAIDDSDRRAAADQLIYAYAVDREIICESMASAFLEWREYFGRIWGYAPEARDDYQVAMWELQAARKARAIRAVRELDQLLAESEREHEAPVFEVVRRLEAVVFDPMTHDMRQW
jgi:hypothetical protein